tara:strand:- start:45 stop:1067 length:1023 start_codon:yes stop_codon:yes gene_type:complete
MNKKRINRDSLEGIPKIFFTQTEEKRMCNVCFELKTENEFHYLDDLDCIECFEELKCKVVIKKKIKNNRKRKEQVVLSDEVYLQMVIELEDELLKNERSGKIIKQEISDKYNLSISRVESTITRYNERSKNIPKRIYKTGSARWGTLKYHEGVDPREGTYNYKRNVTQKQIAKAEANRKSKAKKNSAKQYKRKKASGEAKEYDKLRNLRNKDRLKYKYENDPIYRLRKKIRGHVRRFAKGYDRESVRLIVGCTYEEFQKYLGVEKETEDLDHIIPLSWGLSKEEMECLSHYSNFQYLDHVENVKKGNRYVNKNNLDIVLKNHNNLDLLNKIIERNLNKIK